MKIKKNIKLRSYRVRKINGCRPMSTPDFALALANDKPDLKLGKSVSQSAACIQMMSKPCEILPCSSD